MLVDHKFHNGLDNRRENIRIVTNGENLRNRIDNVEFQSNVDGVYWNAQGKTWRVEILVDGRYEYLASSKDQIVAEAASFMFQEIGKRLKRVPSLGVTWNKAHKAWQAYPSTDGKQVFLGLYDTKSEAEAASSMYLETGMRVKRSRKVRKCSV